jgi:SAM-dependent MidA family methyltransferase
VSSEKLLRFLLDLQQECHGVIPFERFMQEALYHPLYGYYSAQIKDVGASGDFSTSASLDPQLGKAIASWIKTRCKELGGWRIPVIEIGAGNGGLASSVLHHLDWTLRWRVDYMIHETSPVLRKQQKKRLRWQGIRWVSDLAETLKDTDGRALIFSNELVDAFPCILFQKQGSTWQEMGVSISEKGDLSEKIVGYACEASWFDQFDHLPEGQRIEKHASYRKWLRGWSDHWKKGSLLTIDYGETAKYLYHRKHRGSLRAYWRHNRLTGHDLYARFGKQDLTADVNFSDLIAWGTELGWKNYPLITQGEFVTEWCSKRPSERILPQEAGEAFKVLEQTIA